MIDFEYHDNQEVLQAIIDFYEKFKVEKQMNLVPNDSSRQSACTVDDNT